jgi:hypothetical protein
MPKHRQLPQGSDANTVPVQCTLESSGVQYSSRVHRAFPGGSRTTISQCDKYEFISGRSDDDQPAYCLAPAMILEMMMVVAQLELALGC